MNRSISFDNVDIDMLKKQKDELLHVIWNIEEDNTTLWGLVSLLDEIQDQIDPP